MVRTALNLISTTAALTRSRPTKSLSPIRLLPSLLVNLMGPQLTRGTLLSIYGGKRSFGFLPAPDARGVGQRSEMCLLRDRRCYSRSSAGRQVRCVQKSAGKAST